MAPTDEIVKNVADEGPRHIVERCSGRQVVCTYKDNREIEVLEEIDFERFVCCPLGEGCNRANQERKKKTVEEVTVREQTLWSDHTPL